MYTSFWNCIIKGFVGAFVLVSYYAYAEHTTLPKGVLSILAQHSTWQSSFVFQGKFSKFPIQLSKKWRYVSGSMNPKLKEISSESEKTTISLSSPFSLHLLTSKQIHNNSNTRSINLKMKIHSGDIIVLTPAIENWYILFFPEYSFSKATQTQTINTKINISRTPLGIYTDQFKYHYKLSPTQGKYLHHDINKSMPVRLVSPFPKKFKPTVKQVLKMWNNGLNSQFYYMDSTSESLSHETSWVQCLSQRAVCIGWMGPEAIDFTSDIKAHTVTQFDPETGIIIGGLIQFYPILNSQIQRGLTEICPRKYTTLFETHSFDATTSLECARNDMTQYTHPDEKSVFAQMLSHEFGHINGWTSNYKGSNSGTIQSPSKSIMDILPFSVVHKLAGKLQSYDKNMLEFIQNGTKPPTSYETCGYLDTKHPQIKHRDPNCNIYDLGDPVEWYIKVSKISTPFTKLNTGLSPMIHLGLFLSNSTQSTASSDQKKRARDFLCNHEKLNKITKNLKKNLDVTLICNK